jgi:hypothetical protein
MFTESLWKENNFQMDPFNQILPKFTFNTNTKSKFVSEESENNKSEEKTNSVSKVSSQKSSQSLSLASPSPSLTQSQIQDSSIKAHASPPAKSTLSTKSTETLEADDEDINSLL